MPQWTSPTAETGASDNRNATTEFVTSAVNTVISAVSTAIAGLTSTIVEVQSTVTVTVSLSGTAVNLVTATLTTGSWDCSGLANWDSTSAGFASASRFYTSISTVSATHNLTKSAYSQTGNNAGAVTAGPYTTSAGPVRVVLTVSGNIFLVVTVSAAASTTSVGYIQAISA